MDFFLSISWTVDPEIIQIGSLRLRWYGLLFATGFLLALEMAKRMWKHEGLPERWLEFAFLFVFIGTVLGARLGHVFFYDWDYYKDHVAEIFQIWRGGLASHGAVIGISLALWIYSRFVSKRPLLWIIDRAAAVIPLAGGFIRLGNLMNHEIYGKPTDLPWGFVFSRVDDIARHPSQIYEALAYFAIFAFMMYLYWRTNAKDKIGFLSGVFFITTFGFRILVEFLKENQSAFESDLLLNMGQLLSIPLVLLGVFLVIRAQKKGPVYFDNHLKLIEENKANDKKAPKKEKVKTKR